MSSWGRMLGDNGRPKKPIVEHLCFRHASASDENLILEIFRKSPNYFLRVDGVEPSLTTVKHAVADCPPKRGESYRKEFLIVENQNQPIGVVDRERFMNGLCQWTVGPARMRSAIRSMSSAV